MFIETQNKNKLYLTFFLICHLFASGPGLEQNIENVGMNSSEPKDAKKG